MFSKRGQGISISTIIIAIISLVVLVVLILIFTGYFGGFSATVGGKVYCETRPAGDTQSKVAGGFVLSEDNCPFTQRKLGTFEDVRPTQVCCKTQSGSAAPAQAASTGGIAGGTPGLTVGGEIPLG